MRYYFKTILIVLATLCISAEVFAQNITMRVKDVTVKDAMTQLEKQTKYSFVFSSSDFNAGKIVSFSLKNATIDEAVKAIVAGQKNITYSIQGDKIIIKKVAKPVSDNTSRKISGRVLNMDKQPVIGAAVKQQGTLNGGVTDVEGYFTVTVPEDAVLEVSCIGYVTKTISSLTDNSQIVLEEDKLLLDEVVVVGYGTQKKINLTGAVASASGEVLEDRPIGNIAQGLQGLVPNLNITFNSGQPNASATINIRGNTSLNGGNALILVDGVEIADLSLVNPQDVESVSVLKDASAAAVYGARAAFGVMLITTKKGSRNGQIKVNYNNNFSWSTPARIPDMPRSDVWARMWNKAYDYDSPGGYYFNDKFMAALDAHIADPENNPAILVDTEGIQNSNYTPSNPGWAYVGNTDWLNEFYKDAALMQQHNVSLSGGSKSNNYYASIGYKDQDGIFRYGNDNYKRFNLAFNFDTKVSDWLDLSFSTRLSNIKNDEPYKSGTESETWYYDVYRMYPTLSVFLPNGDFAGIYLNSGNFNIIGKMALAGRNVKKTWDQWYTGKFDLHPLKGLSIKGDYSWNRYSTVQKIHKKTMTQTFPEGREDYLAETPNSVTNYNSNNFYQAINVYAEYKHSFNEDHNLSLMAGYNQEQKTYASTSYTMTDLYDNDLPISDLAINYKTNSETKDIWRVQGLFYRFNYDYKSKYLLEVNGRYDGSSKYAKDDRWAFFPSVSAGWRISKEGFMNTASDFVNDLKIRASVGSLGNQVTSGNHSYMSVLTGTSISNYMMNGSILTGLNTPTLESLVTWEKVNTYDVGLDWALFGSRFSGSFDYYVRDTKGMVRSVKLPAVLGTSGGKENIADMRTKGWEAEVSWKDRINNLAGSPFDYSLTIGVSDYQAEITKYDNPTGSLASGMFYKGQKLGEIRGYVTDGFIKDENEAAQMNYIQKYISSKWYPGDIRYKDINGDGVIDGGTSTLDDPGDKKVIGNSTPRYRFNIQAGFGWHNFDLSVLFEGVAKRDLWTSSDIFWGYSRGIYNSCVTQYHIDNTWTLENQNAYYPRLTASGNNRSKQVQTKYLQNAAYIRLKDVTLSYTLPEKWTSKVKIGQTRVYVSGMNLWEATGLPSFMTPDIVDQISSYSSSPNAGKEYAFMRSYSFGVNITF